MESVITCCDNYEFGVLLDGMTYEVLMHPNV